MSEVIKTIMKQVDAKYLGFAGYRLVKIDDNTLRINKGKKNVDISYNEGLDLYDVKLIKVKKDFSWETKELRGMYWDQLRDLISGHLRNIDYHVADTLRSMVKQ